MNNQEILALFDAQERRNVTFPDMRRDVCAHVVRYVGTPSNPSFVLYSHLNKTNADGAIQEQIDFFSQRQLSFEWKVYDHDKPSDLLKRLLDSGFELEDTDAVMVLDVHDAPATLLPSPNVDVRPVTRPEGLDDVRRVEEQVWGGDFDRIQGRLRAHLQIPGLLSVYVAYVDDTPACAGWTYYNANSDFAGLWGGSTLEQYRGRGLYTALLAARVQEAIRRGRRFLTIDANPMSQPIVSRYGFRLLAYAHACRWKNVT
ncbi:MAG TPA: GNAT family N-acetyltransferase [Caldilineae bacterium]|nr:GNAT family N-acetyltransferase [Caldilineae bacterium]